MKTRRDGKIRFQHKPELVDNTLAPGARVRDEQPRFGRIEHALGGVHELTELQRRRPHRSLPASDRRAAVPVVEHLVWYKRSPKTQQTQFDAADIEAPCRRLVNHMKVVNVVLSCAELFEDGDVLAGTPDGEDGHLQLDLASEE